MGTGKHRDWWTKGLWKIGTVEHRYAPSARSINGKRAKFDLASFAIPVWESAQAWNDPYLAGPYVYPIWSRSRSRTYSIICILHPLLNLFHATCMLLPRCYSSNLTGHFKFKDTTDYSNMLCQPCHAVMIWKTKKHRLDFPWEQLQIIHFSKQHILESQMGDKYNLELQYIELRSGKYVVCL